MSIIIKGLDMPRSCDICPFVKTNDDLSAEDYRSMYCDVPGIGEFVTDYEATRHPDCPLAPVPPHGRLIDADALSDDLITMTVHIETAGSLLRMVRAAPTIIEAEET